MRRGAGAGPPRSRSLGMSTVALLSGLCALVFGYSAGLSEPVSSLLAMTGEASAATTAAAPDPKPPPPKPDPKPKPPPPPAPPPAPPPPPPPPAPTAPTPAPTQVASTPPPPAVSQTPAKRARPVTRRTRRATQSSRQKARPTGARVNTKRVHGTSRSKPVDTLAGTALPAVPGTRLTAEPQPAGSGVVFVFAALCALGLLMLGVSAVPPRRVPWPVLAGPLFVHRGNLVAIGVGTFALALLCLNIAVVL
jgi:outer membrane biosynthesis protein TonB